MTARKVYPVSGRTPPPCPNYSDEITKEQHDGIRKLANPDGKQAERKLLHASAW